MSDEPQSHSTGLQGVLDALRVITIIGKGVVVLLVIGFCFSGVRSLDDSEMGIVLRFGAMHGEVRQESGPIIALPYPIDEIVTIPAKRLRTIKSDTHWYALTEEEERTGEDETATGTLSPGVDGSLLTADQNLVHAACSLNYRVTDPKKFIFDYGDSEALLRVHLDDLIVKTAAVRTAADAVGDPTGFGLQIIRSLNGLGLGIEIDSIDMNVEWPRLVKPDITKVADATNDKGRRIADAGSYGRRRKNEAKSEASKIEFEALAWAQEHVGRTVADARTFERLYPKYLANPDVVRRTLYEDRMRRIVADAAEIFLIRDSDKRELRIDLQRRRKPKNEAND